MVSLTNVSELKHVPTVILDIIKDYHKDLLNEEKKQRDLLVFNGDSVCLAYTDELLGDILEIDDIVKDVVGFMKCVKALGNLG